MCQAPVKRCARAQCMQLAVCCLSAISGFLFGYDLCVMMIALPLIQNDFQLSTTNTEAIVSSLMIGAVIGSLLGGIVADRIGRKPAIIVTAGLFFSGSVVMTFAPEYSILIIGRFLAGLAVGSCGPCVSVYIVEIVLPQHRGALVTINEVMLCVGCLVSIYVSGSYEDSENGWRKMLGFTIIPPIIQSLGMLFMPESPRWLLANNRSSEAEEVMLGLLLSSSTPQTTDDKKISNIQEDTNKQVEPINEVNNFYPGIFNQLASQVTFDSIKSGIGGFKQLWNVIVHNSIDRKRLILSVAAAIAHAMTGANAILYFSRYILEHLKDATSLTTSTTLWEQEIIIACVKLGGVGTAILIVDRVGRRPLLLCGTFVMCICDCVLAYCFASHSFGAIGVLAVYIFIFAWNVSWAPMMWVVCSEILPDEIRSLGMGVVFAMFWLGCAFMNQTILSSFNIYGIATTFDLYGISTLAAFLFVHIFIPETKGLSLEDITNLFVKDTIV